MSRYTKTYIIRICAKLNLEHVVLHKFLKSTTYNILYYYNYPKLPIYEKINKYTYKYIFGVQIYAYHKYSNNIKYFVGKLLIKKLCTTVLSS